MSTLVSKLDKVVKNTPEQIAIVFNDTKIEYGRFHEAVLKLAQGLHDLGVAKGDRVGLMLPNVPHFCISYYAAISIGAIAVPINFQSLQSDIEYYLQDSGAKVMITWQGFCNEVLPAVEKTETCREILVLGNKIPGTARPLTQIIASSKSLSESVSMDSSDVAVINYSAGITNKALGAMMTHEALIANANAARNLFMLTSKDTLVSPLSLSHPLAQTLQMNAAFFSGGTLSLISRFNPNDVVENIQKNRGTFFCGVPDMYKSLAKLEIDQSNTPSLKHCLCYGGHLAEKVIEQFEAKFDAFVYQSYGLTEAGPLVASNRFDKDRKSQSVGLPLVGVDIQIRGQNGSPLKPNESGEIWIYSPSTMKGYFNRQDETDKRFRDNWLFTGDIGYLDEDHYLYIQERKEDIIMKGGFQIFPRQIESVLAQHDLVDEVAVVGVPDPVQGSELKALIVPKKNAEINRDDIMEFCKNSLPVYKIPKYIEFTKELPKSAAGRVLKHVIRQNLAATKNPFVISNKTTKIA